jgi:glycosyltransferase involved in cell wall biosynthesis
VLFKSQWQAAALCEVSGFPPTKSWILSNGLNLKDFAGTENRKRKRLIYSSIPGRGLKNLLEYYPLIKQKHPDAELHIFSSLDRTSRNWPPEEDLDQPLEKLRQSLARLSDCYVHKSILQKDLAREFMKSSILAYPTHFEETCCSTALEAQVAGCVTVTTKLGSLPETVGDTGLLIKGVPGKGDYAAKFIDAVDRLLSDDALFHTLSLKGLERAKQLDWKTKAEELICYLQEKHGL